MGSISSEYKELRNSGYDLKIVKVIRGKSEADQRKIERVEDEGRRVRSVVFVALRPEIIRQTGKTGLVDTRYRCLVQALNRQNRPAYKITIKSSQGE